MKAIIVECLLPQAYSRTNELFSMASTIGYHIVDIIIQKRKSVHHSYTIGPGKLQYVKKIVTEKGINIIIFANALPSSHIFKIQKKIGNDVKVIDRNLLILELFEKRARTREALLQIQLARLKYTFSWGREYLKLKGILEEQVGWSGPGEYPFQDYEREARRRISKVKQKLEIIRRKKDSLRDHRHELGFPLVALAGYTQSGKTTFFNRVTNEVKQIGLGPFTTLQTFARKVHGKVKGDSFILIDSIGFIEDLHSLIIDAFDATLKEIASADVVLVFVDASDELPIISRKLVSSNNILRRIGVTGDIIICVNKIDLISKSILDNVVRLVKRYFPGIEVAQISAKNGDIEDLLALLQNRLSHIKNKYIGVIT